MQERSGGKFKGMGFSLEYYWPAVGMNADFNTWCKIGKWCGLQQLRLRKLKPLEIAREVAKEFPVLTLVRCCDEQGSSAEVGRV